jgi:hypothetical protein
MENAVLRKLACLTMGVVVFGVGPAGRAQEGPLIPRPTAEHERLAREAGTWDATIKSWMQGPGSEPTISRGVQVAKLMPGGLWLISSFEGKFGGQDFHGSGQMGYDPKKGKYGGTWIDSMATEILLMEGAYDDKTHTLTMQAKATDPSGKPYEARMSTKYEGEDSMVFNMEMKSEETRGEYFKLMEITYKRKAK